VAVLRDVLEPGLRLVLCGTVPGFVARMATSAPAWVAFTSKEAGKAVARALGAPARALGLQAWTVAGSKVFVLPSPSGRNQGRGTYDGRSTRLEWWIELREVVSLAGYGRTPQ